MTNIILNKGKLFTAFILVFFLIFSCQEKDEVLMEQGELALSFQNISVNGRTLTADSAPKSILISVKDANGELVLNLANLPLYSVGGKFVTEEIRLEPGAYTVDAFLVLDASQTAIYLTPKSDSEFADLIPDPLPQSFTIASKESKEVTLNVVPADLGEPVDYGYASFSFNIVNVAVIRPDSASGKDAIVASGAPDNNYADFEEFHLYSWTHIGVPVVNRLAIDFDLSFIPSDATIDSAYLSVYFNPTSVFDSGEGHVGENSFFIQKITENWSEDTITWNNKPAITSVNQVLVESSDDPHHDFTGIDVTTLVEDLYLNPNDGFGFMLRYQFEQPYKITHFASSNHPDESVRPKLVVYYH